ncbi:zinc-ribbon domain-containing protein [Lacticaseibacillus zeae]|uniref:Zinc-ribbon domain-containing protein n=1 Tax=Lacticaseibacillus zeae subsp. silagei TaxID=3068307 RepID=A0ABD7Z6X2_LACZE|nr:MULTISPECIES: zinc ribbon domain-containing protein [Lacticaseibacillus]MDE3315804.1 zinc-ribbon domain-containing protein [Lacticaseibacillus zeae]OFR91471.1 surfactant protein C, propeptide [Lactobacillus sp. HMSC068F07]WLV82854.1 zinc-ribbon domain-containing protein [Lacticaseibacillus sp. NCIMB 15475]WLV85595.1 zinc-ribbon domain-containing protein [Lacticaseibacillus sp. NCIMB 15474]
MAFCPNCGAQVSADETFCHQCGFNLAQYRAQHQGTTGAENGSSNASSTGPTPQPTAQGAVPPNTRRQRSNGGAPNGPRRPWLMVSLVLAAAVIVVIAVLFFQNQSQQTQEAAANSASASAANASSASFASASASASQAAASSLLAASQEAASESLANASESAAAESHESTTTTAGGSDLSNRQVAKMAADLDDFDLDEYRVEVTSPATNMKEVDVYDKDDGELHNKYRYDEIHDQMSKYDDDSGKWELIQDDDD